MYVSSVNDSIVWEIVEPRIPGAKIEFGFKDLKK